MINYKTGDITKVTEGIIMHGCNAQGVMGSGVALAIKKKFPWAYKAYMDHFDYGEGLKLGEIIWSPKPSGRLWVANAITQDRYGKNGKRYVNYSAIVSCFSEAIRYADSMELSLNFPKIGAGRGGGDWNIIEQLINDCDPNDEVDKICWEL